MRFLTTALIFLYIALFSFLPRAQAQPEQGTQIATICTFLSSQVPADHIEFALANPLSIPGFDQNSTPPSTLLTLSYPQRAYHPLYNRLKFAPFCNGYPDKHFGLRGSIFFNDISGLPEKSRLLVTACKIINGSISSECIKKFVDITEIETQYELPNIPIENVAVVMSTYVYDAAGIAISFSELDLTLKPDCTSKIDDFTCKFDPKNKAPTTLHFHIKKGVEIIPNIEKSKTKRVLLLKSNPYLSTEKKTMYQLFPPGKKPDDLANEAIGILNNLTQNFAKYEIVDDIETNELLPLLDKQVNLLQYEKDLVSCKLKNFGTDEKLNPACARLQKAEIDYEALFDKFNICKKDGSGLININEIDEVWTVVFPYTGVGEGDMVGPAPFGINGRVQKITTCKRNVPVMSIDITVLAHFFIHSYAHRVEFTMHNIYKWTMNNVWGKYLTSTGPSIDIAGCGNIHFPPNTTEEFRYNSDDEKISYCNGFLKYPHFEFARDTLSCAHWNCNPEGFYVWWLNHIPNNPGKAPDGRLNNWWIYVNDPDYTAQEAQRLQLDVTRADTNDDGTVNTFDLAMLLENYQEQSSDDPSFSAQDIVSDGSINALDYSFMINQFGGETEPEELPVTK